MGMPFDVGSLLLIVLGIWLVVSIGAFALFWAAIYIGSERRRSEQAATRRSSRSRTARRPVSVPVIRDGNDNVIAQQPAGVDHV